MKKQKRVALAGVALIVGATFWMRNLASWRPRLIAKARFWPTLLRFGSDGKRFLVADDFGHKQIFFPNGALDANAKTVSGVEPFNPTTTFPRIWFNSTPRLLYSSRARGQSIELEVPNGVSFKGLASTREFAPGYSQKGEIYKETQRVIFVWNARDGKLKKRVRLGNSPSMLARSIFSPDGKWLIAFEKLPDGNGFSRRYDLQSGKMVQLINQATDVESLGFSPDGRLFWFVQQVGFGDFNVFRADNWKFMWGAWCNGTVKWLPDGRSGLFNNTVSNGIPRQVALFKSCLAPSETFPTGRFRPMGIGFTQSRGAAPFVAGARDEPVETCIARLFISFALAKRRATHVSTGVY